MKEIKGIIQPFMLERGVEGKLRVVDRWATMSCTSKALSPAEAERLRRKAEQAQRQKRKLPAQVCGIGILMIGAVVADYLFIQWGR